MAIEIYDPEAIPFGALSDNHVDFLKIDTFGGGGQTWSTVTNYILSNLLVTPLYKLLIKFTPPEPKLALKVQEQWCEYYRGKRICQERPMKIDVAKQSKRIIRNIETREKRILSDQEKLTIVQNVEEQARMQQANIYDLFEYYTEQEITSVIRRAVETAYNLILDEKVSETLLSTEERPIIYKSQNLYLGVNGEGNGRNMIGRTLMQIRHFLQVKGREGKRLEERKEKEEEVLKVYKALLFLEEEIKRGNDLEEYLGKTYDYLSEQYLRDIEHKRADVLQFYNQGLFPQINKALEDPTILASLVRRENVSKIQEKKEEEKKNLILSLYVQDTIKRLFPNMEPENVELASKQLYLTVPPEKRGKDYFELRDRVVRLFDIGALTPELTRQIKDALEAVRPVIEEESSEKTRESTSSDEEPIAKNLKELLSTDAKQHKKYLIQRLVRYTGKAPKSYRDWDVERIERHLEKYEKGSKDPKSGHWEIRTKAVIHGHIKSILLSEEKEKPSEEIIQKKIKKYNKHRASSKISRGNVYLLWVPVKLDPSREDEEEEARESLEEARETSSTKALEEFVDLDHQKPLGEPITFSAIDEGEFKIFSPIFPRTLTVEGIPFPNISLYITAMMLTLTGYDKSTLQKGRTLRAVVPLLMDEKQRFVSPDVASRIFDRENVTTFRDLLSKLAEISLGVKFENRSLQLLLLATEDQELIWNEPHDVILGSGTKDHPGENMIGKMLMNMRENFRAKEKKVKRVRLDKPLFVLILKDPLVKKWMTEKLSDMCNAVFNFRQYLALGKVEEPMDVRLVRRVLNFVFQPEDQDHDSIAKELKISVPLDFADNVLECQGVSWILTKDYGGELSRLYEKLTELDYGVNKPMQIVKKTTPATLKKLIKAQIKQMKKMRRDIQDKPDDVQAHLLSQLDRIQEKELNSFFILEEKIDPFVERQKNEWEAFLAEINKPKNPEKVPKLLRDLRVKQDQELQDARDNNLNREGMEKLEKLQAKEMKETRTRLLDPIMPSPERMRRIAEFQAKQDAERDEHYGIVRQLDPETITRLTKESKDVKDKITALRTELRKEVEASTNMINSIVTLYWSRLVAMIYLKAVKTREGKKITIEDFRNDLIKTEYDNSLEKPCENAIVHSDKDCVVSALTNVLIALAKFKTKYADQLPLGVNDILVAKNTILKLPVVEEREEKAPEKGRGTFEELEEQQEENLKPIPARERLSDDRESEAFSVEDFGVEEEAMEAEEDLERERGSDQESVFDEGAVFGMGKKQPRKDRRTTFLQILETIGKIEDVTDTADSFESASIEIAKLQESNPNLVYRVNLFATLR